MRESNTCKFPTIVKEDGKSSFLFEKIKHKYVREAEAYYLFYFLLKKRIVSQVLQCFISPLSQSSDQTQKRENANKP